MSDFRHFDPSQGMDALNGYQLPKTCIVTSELVGFYKNGGVGTAMTGIAELLAASGGEITVIYTGPLDESATRLVDKYHAAGINVELLGNQTNHSFVGPFKHYSWTNAWALLQLLRQRDFDVIHFNDTLGEGCYCFLAKKYGMAFENTLLTLAVHSPIEWILESNRQPPLNLWYSLCIAAEKISIATADLLWGPSDYILNWLQEHDYTLPRQVYRQQHVIPSDRLFDGGRSIAIAEASVEDDAHRIFPTEVVFFGRLEERKGIRLFAAALDRLNDTLAQHNISVTFMGKEGHVAGSSAKLFLQDRASEWTFDWRVEDEFGQQEALAYLRRNDQLAVMPSPVDNSPCTVYEVLRYQIPFVACRSGGIPELIDERFHSTHLFDYTASSLAETILRSIFHGIEPAEATISIAENENRWLGFHANWKQYLPLQNPKESRCTWGVLIDDRGDDKALVKTVHAVQSTGNGGVACIAINTGSRSARHIDLGPDVLTVDDNGPLGAEDCFSYFREREVTHLCALRAGVLPSVKLFEALARALECDADAVVPAIRIESNGGTALPMAGSAAFAFLESQLDPGAVAIRLDNPTLPELAANMSVLRPHLGLMDELYARGAQVWPYPDTLVSVPHYDGLKIAAEGFSRLSAYKTLADKEVFEILSILEPYYPRFSDALSVESSSITSSLRRYLYSNPLPVRVLLGNKIARKVAKFVFRLSQLPR